MRTEPVSGRDVERNQSRLADRLTFIGHATTLLRLGPTSILTDPILRGWVGPLRRQVPTPRHMPAHSADLAVISHLHRDHLDLRSVRRLAPSTTVIVPRGAGSLVSRAGDREVIELAPGDETAFGEVTVTAVPAVHDSRRDPWGPRAQPVGYVLSSSWRRIYFAGDTDIYREMSDLRPLDLALVPVWGWGPVLGPGHMSPRRAALALQLLLPKLAVPIHWGTLYPPGLRRLRPHPLASPPLDFSRFARELAPDVRIRILQPGASLTLAERESP